MGFVSLSRSSSVEYIVSYNDSFMAQRILSIANFKALTSFKDQIGTMSSITAPHTVSIHL